MADHAVPKTPWGLLKWCLTQRQRPVRGPISGTMVMPKVNLPEGYEPPSAAIIGATQATEHVFEIARLRQAIRGALDELGVPGPGYPAPVTNAVGILRRALLNDGSEGA